jgi:hypothetical protein
MLILYLDIAKFAAFGLPVVSIAAADPKSIRSTVSEVPELQAKLGG